MQLFPLVLFGDMTSALFSLETELVETCEYTQQFDSLFRAGGTIQPAKRSSQEIENTVFLPRVL